MSVFTPSNEPYLGLASVLAFDELIVATLEVNGKIAPYTHKIKKTELQWAACQLISSSLHLALSIRELVRQAYLHGAHVLCRPLTERTIILLYLQKNPTEVSKWTAGWKHGDRPSLAKMIEKIAGHKFPGCGSLVTKDLNSLTHGDPDSASGNFVDMGDGSIGHAPSKMLDRPDLASEICMQAGGWLGVLLGMMIAIFPDAVTAEAKT